MDSFNYFGAGLVIVGVVGVLLWAKSRTTSRRPKKKRKERKRSVLGKNEGEHGRNTLVGPPYPNDKLITDSGGLMPFLHKVHARFGSVAQVWMGEEPCVSITDPALLKHVQREGDRPRFLFKFLEGVLGADNIQVYDAERAKQTRRLLLQAFSHTAIKKKFAEVRKVALQVSRKWASGTVVDVQADLLNAGFKVSILANLGISEYDEPDQFRMHYDRALKLSFDSQFRELTAEEQTQCAESTRELKRILRDLRRAAKDDEDLPRILADNGVSEEEADMLVAAMVIAAYHTSAVAASWTLYHLSCAHDVQDRVRAELETVDLSSLEKIEALPYLHATVQEAMRLTTPGPFAARVLRKEIAVPDQHTVIPAGTTVLIPMQTIHLDPEVFPEPSKFNPDRFLTSPMPARTYLPFGIGNRICIGERFAWFETKVLLANLLKAHTFDESHEIPEKSVRFVQMAKNGINLKITR